MASLRQAAQSVLDEGRDGIGWIACWKEGRGWGCESFWPDLPNDHQLIFEDYDIERLQEILKTDPHAILVNSYYHNLGDVECMTRDSLADALRWQYDLQRSMLADALSCGAHI